MLGATEALFFSQYDFLNGMAWRDDVMSAASSFLCIALRGGKRHGYSVMGEMGCNE